MVRVLGILANPIGWIKPSIIGGGEISSIELMKRLKDRGIEIETIEPNPSPPLHHEPNYPVYEIKLPTRSGVVPSSSIIKFFIWVVRAFCLIRKLRHKKYDLVIALTSNLSDVIPAKIANVMLKAPFMVIFHVTCYSRSVLTSYKLLRSEGSAIFDSLIRGFGATLTLTLAKGVAACLCVSRSVAKTLLESGFKSNKIRITGIGINANYINSVGSREKMYDAAFLGRVEKSKGIPDLLTAWREIVKKRGTAKLIIMGDGSYLEEAKKIVRRLKMKGSVRFTGFIKEREKYLHLKESKLLVFPTKAREGWGRVVAEAMTCGLPVICYDNPVLMDVFGDCESVLFVQTGDVKKLAETISFLLENNGVSKKYSELSKENVKRYDWNEVVPAYLKVIEETVRS